MKHYNHPHWIGCDNRCVDDPTYVQTELDKAYDGLQKAIKRAILGFDAKDTSDEDNKGDK